MLYGFLALGVLNTPSAIYAVVLLRRVIRRIGYQHQVRTPVATTRGLLRTLIMNEHTREERLKVYAAVMEQVDQIEHASASLLRHGDAV